MSLRKSLSDASPPAPAPKRQTLLAQRSNSTSWVTPRSRVIGSYSVRPGEDVTSILLAQLDSVDGRVSETEFETLFWLFSVAGNETLRNGLPGGMIALLEHPVAQDVLRADPDRLDLAVEEMLRWWTPVMVFRRTATIDTQIASVRVRAGDKVVVSFASANRDETVFADPDGFHPARQPNPHLTFGHGPHFCLGAHLARVQMKALFSELLTRTSTIEYAGQPAYLRSTFQRGVKHLPIRWQVHNG
jgi:cytochrome P450